MSTSTTDEKRARENRLLLGMQRIPDRLLIEEITRRGGTGLDFLPDSVIREAAKERISGNPAAWILNSAQHKAYLDALDTISDRTGVAIPSILGTNPPRTGKRKATGKTEARRDLVAYLHDMGWGVTEIEAATKFSRMLIYNHLRIRKRIPEASDR